MSRKKCIFLTGGGTAGHVTPNLALIPFLREDGWEIHYLGTPDGMERELVAPIEGVSYHAVESGRLRRYFSLKTVVEPFHVLQGIRQARKLVQRLRPDIVFAKGGFVSVPAVYAAAKEGVPIVLHESDCSPGLANKLCAPKATVLCTSFELKKEDLPRTKARLVWTGSPIRQQLLQGDAAKALKKYGLDARPVLLVTGGSQGSAAINTAVDEALPTLLDQYNIVHLRGKGNLAPQLDGKNGYVQIEYATSEMADLFALADCVICRAGANTLFELLALKKPMVLIPLPLSSSRGDQLLNAGFFERQGYARVLMQEQLDTQSLVAAVADTLRRAPEYRAAMAASPMQDGTANVLREIYRTVRLPLPEAVREGGRRNG